MPGIHLEAVLQAVEFTASGQRHPLETDRTVAIVALQKPDRHQRICEGIVTALLSRRALPETIHSETRD